MAKDSTGQAGRGGPQPRKPVTIDLSAEEVARKEAESASASHATPAAAAEGKAAGPDAGPKGAEAPSKGKEGGKPAAPLTPSAFASTSRTERSAPEAPKSRASSFVPLLLAGLVGGAIVALAVVAMAIAGFLRPAVEEAPDFAGEIAALKGDVAALKGADASRDLEALQGEVATLRESVGALENTPPAAAPEEAALQALDDRLAQLDERVSQIASGAASGDGVAPDLSGIEGSVDELRQQLTALSGRIDEAPGEERVRSLETELAKVGSELATAQALAPAVAADALAAAIDAGRPYASELTALQGLGVDADKLAMLEPHAERGLATLAAIRARFEADVEALDLTPPVAEGSGPIDRLLQSARGLVEVRPANPTEGADPAAVVTRIRAALAAGDLRTALVEWGALPDPVRAATSGWKEVAETRLAADDIVAELRAAALARLGSDG